MRNDSIPDVISRKEYIRLSTIWKYKRSMSIDHLFTVFGVVGIFFSLGALFDQSNDSVPFMIFLGFILMVIVLTLSDFFMKGRSLGKRIMKIGIVSKNEEDKVSIKAICYRRILEAAIHPLFMKSFASKADYIERQTNTRIIDLSFQTNHKDN